MSKIATYLNEHLSGEVILSDQDIEKTSVDGSVLLQKPEMVAYVANTSDIRKIARFSWQLAEKGHTLPIVARGGGTNTVGSAIGAGVVISMDKYMSRIVGLDTKQRLVHAQAGTGFSGINLTLSTHRGQQLPFDSHEKIDSKLGGAIASGSAGWLSSRYGTVGDSVKQLEVVLANGDVLQTGRLTKRELNAKKGLHTMEGEIYRQVDNLITDNLDLIKSLSVGSGHNTSGYQSIAEVKRKDGSFDLTPLFIGSQGTLGIISEAIMQAQFSRQEFTVVLAGYSSLADAQAAADKALETKASAVEVIDGRIIARALKLGKKREFAPEEVHSGALVVSIFDDYSQKDRTKSSRKLHRQLSQSNTAAHLSTKSYNISEMVDIYSLISVSNNPSDKGVVVPGVFKGLWLPVATLDSFLSGLKEFEAEYGIELPFFTDLKSGFIDILPEFDVKKVSDRQKLVRLIVQIGGLVHKLNGSMAGHGGEGRVKSLITQSLLDEDAKKLYEQIKQIFDPHGILNPGVKQPVDTKELVVQLNAWARTVI